VAMAPLWAQAPLPNSEKASPEPEALHIRVVNADSLQSPAHSGAKQSLSIEVTDSSGAAVSSAAVTCRLPDSGATGTFGDGSHAAVAYTDDQGRAVMDAIQWGSAAGPVAIRLTATKGTAHTGILVEAVVAAAPLATAREASVPAPRETGVAAVAPAAQRQPAPDPPVIGQTIVSVTRPVRQPGQIQQQAAAVGREPNKLTPEAADPSVSVTRTAAADAPHSSHAKWFVLVGVIAAAGAGAAFAMKGKSGTSSTPSNPSLSIGAPSISVGSGH
jgi:hypothetical protein